MKIYQGIDKSISIESELAMSGVLIAVMVEKKTGEKVSLADAKFDVSLTSGADVITILPRRQLDELCDVTNLSDSANIQWQDEDGNKWRYYSIPWTGYGDSMVHMKPNSRYTINLSGLSAVTPIRVSAIRDESHTNMLVKASVLSVDNSQQVEQNTVVKNGQVVALSVPISPDATNMDYTVKIRFANNRDVVYGMDELLFNAFSHDASDQMILKDDMEVEKTFNNKMLNLPLTNSDVDVDSVTIQNNTGRKMEVILLTLTTV